MTLWVTKSIEMDIEKLIKGTVKTLNNSVSDKKHWHRKARNVTKYCTTKQRPNLFFKYNYKWAIIGLTFHWWADDCPTLNAGFVAKWFFQGIRTSVANKPYIFVIFQSRSRTPAPTPLHTRMGRNNKQRIHNNRTTALERTAAIAVIWKEFRVLRSYWHPTHVDCKCPQGLFSKFQYITAAKLIPKSK